MASFFRLLLLIVLGGGGGFMCFRLLLVYFFGGFVCVATIPGVEKKLPEYVKEGCLFVFRGVVFATVPRYQGLERNSRGVCLGMFREAA